MQDLKNQLDNLFGLLHGALKQIGKRGKEYAEKEATYRSELSKAMLLEREAGLPATILSDVCRGKDDIALLKLERDIADAKYKAALEAVNVYKLRIKSLEAQIEREWRG